MYDGFKEELSEKQKRVELLLKESFGMRMYLPQKKVLEAMNYSLSAGGKRLRPILMEEVYKIYGGHRRIIESFMVAIEMIHTYSLIHDDLPAMDNDDLRRGKPTNHKVYGEDIATLAGDGLLNMAFEIAIDSYSKARNKDAVMRSIKILSEKAGVLGMIGGQVLDLENEKNSNILGDSLSGKVNRLKMTSHLKTGALIEASMMIGAVLSGARAEDVQRVELIGKKIGLAFQIKDDILDVTSSDNILGKPIGSDDKNNKVTFASLLGIDECEKQVTELTNEAIMLLYECDGNTDFLKELLLYLVKRNN